MSAIPPAGYPAFGQQQPQYANQYYQQGAAPGMAPYGPQAAAMHGHAAPPSAAGFQGYAQGMQQQYQQQPQQQYHAQQQYQQQPQHQYHQAGHNRVVVVDPRFCLPQQTILVMQEQFGAFRNDNFTITDATGRPFFTLLAAAFSLGSKRQLLDATNRPVVQLDKKLISLHGTWLMQRPADGARLAEVKPSLASLTPSIKVYLNDGDKEADFVIKGDFRSKKFVISQRVSGRSDVVIASVQRESRFASSTAFLMNMMTDAQKYFVTIEPGVDVAFVAALATLCDEIFNDQQGA